MALVDPAALAERLTKVGASASALALAEQAAEQASTYVASYCTRLRVGDPVPPVVEQVATALALRTALNPRYVKGASAEGQSIDYPPLGLTFLESTLLNRYRRRTA